MNKIKEILLNENYTNLDKIIMVYKEVDGKGLQELSAVVNLPVLLLKNWDPGKKPAQIKTQPTKNGSIMKEFIDLFYRMYQKLYNRKYSFSGKEIGQIKNLTKKLKPQEWKSILKMIYIQSERYKNGETFKKKTWTFICENISPSIIMNQLNFILRELGEFKKSKSKDKWGWNNEKNK